MFRLIRMKPPHGWNAVAWELAIVTLGVVIALGAQQIVEALHDRSTAAQTRAEVSEELNSDLMSMLLRSRAEPCIERRLNELRALLLRWEQTGTFPTPTWVAQAPVIEVETSRYDSANSAGRLALLSGDEQYRAGALVNRIRQFNEWQFKERLLWGRLRGLQQGPQALSVTDKSELRTALQDASATDYEIRVVTAQTLPMARRYGFSPDPKGFRDLASQVWPGGKFTPSICSPIDTSPKEGNKRVLIPLPL
ncbi:hypothetical protein [Sphingomonas flavescens]|uniref:hypothetical protein n=1 Tax=Sphingomonas flavescens TaxID=3132797 RepID=UPI0028040FB4|nr:hypothetical protein [Sphingomonas limnosediminicola]